MDDPIELKIVETLESICELVDVFDKAGMYLSEEEYQVALEKGTAFLQRYEFLSQWAQAVGRNIFRIVFKHHTLWHLVENSQYLIPKYHWCFKSEDFVGRISRLAHSVSMGVRSTRLSLKLMFKYMVLMHLRLTRGDISLLDPFDQDD